MTTDEANVARRFELVIAAGAEEQLEQITALRAQGFCVVERPQETGIHQGTLETVSQELWANGDAGMFAAEILADLQSTATGTVVKNTPRGVYYANLPKFELGWKSGAIGDFSLSDAQLDARIHAILGDLMVPFDFVLTKPAVPEANTQFPDVRTILPRIITQNGLGAYAHSKGFDHHGLHEDVGKMLDVMVVAGGRTPSQANTSRSWEGDFVTADQVRERLARADQPQAQSRFASLQQKMRSIIRYQAFSGLAYGPGEIVVRQVNLSKWGSVAMASLLTIAKGYPEGSFMNEFLQQEFAE